MTPRDRRRTAVTMTLPLVVAVLAGLLVLGIAGAWDAGTVVALLVALLAYAATTYLVLRRTSVPDGDGGPP